jgi:acetyl-CoA carboxylase carboxyltransferase component
MSTEVQPTSSEPQTRLRALTSALNQLEEQIKLGGGENKIVRQHEQGKLTARERIDLLLDKGSFSQEIGLLVAYDQFNGAAPSAGVVTTVGRVCGRQVVVVANDATVKAGSWWPETIKKILRAQEIAMRSRIPIIYLVDSAGVNLPTRVAFSPANSALRESFIITRSCAISLRSLRSRQ